MKLPKRREVPEFLIPHFSSPRPYYMLVIIAILRYIINMLVKERIQNKGKFDGKIPFITSLITSSIESKYLKKVYLFGSYANGEPNEDSDIDICVIISNDYDDWKAYMDIKTKFWANDIFPCDLIVSTEEMVEDAIRKNPRCVENTILTEGTVLYGK